MIKILFNDALESFLNIPSTLLRCLRYYLSPEGKQILKSFQNFCEIDNIHRLILVGHSYNYFASLIPYYYINSSIEVSVLQAKQVKSRECILIEPDEFVTYCHPHKYAKDAVFVFVTRTGSTQVYQSIEKLHKFEIDHQKIGVVSNNPKLKSNCNFYFPLLCGDEKVIGSNSFPADILVLYFLTRAFMNQEPIPKSIEDEIRQMIFEIKFYQQDWKFHVSSLNDFLGVDYNFLYFISKGTSLSVAYQGALNSKAYLRLFGEGISIGLFLHGPFQIIDNSFRCILLVSDETSIEDTVNLINIASKKLGSGRIILINNSRALSSLGRANRNVWVFEHTTQNPFLAPIFEMVVLNYLFLDQALRRGVIE
ncbi:MAG: hypothetical protein K9W44_03670 [Candidatus Lokiarchaeota archaeon]|nr:hypothetical protein [Candidatus Harpocratesius repetitus]